MSVFGVRKEFSDVNMSKMSISASTDYNILFGACLSYIMRVHQVHSVVLCDPKSLNIKLHLP